MVKLNEQDRKILATLEFRAHEPLANIARLCKLRESTVRATLQRFISEKLIITRRLYINPYLLGWTNYAIFISFGQEGTKEEVRFKAYLSKQSNVTWIADLGGEYQMSISVAARHISEVADFISKLTENFPGLILAKTISTRVKLKTFPRKYLSENTHKGLEFIQGGLGNYSLDEIDKKIFKAFSLPGFDSFRRLSERMGIPKSTFDRRVKNLIEKGVIQGLYYILEPSLIQIQEYRLLIKVTKPQEKFSERLLAEVKTLPQVRKWIHCVGEWDFELEINVRTGREVTIFISELKSRFANEITTVNAIPLFGEISVPATKAFFN